jgi:hypothetical protein
MSLAFLGQCAPPMKRENKMTIVISKPELFAAAMRFTSTEQSRPYLQAVAVQPRHGGGAFIISTDGHRMFVGIDDGAQWMDGEAHDCLFMCHKQKAPAEAFKAKRLVLDGKTATFYADDQDGAPVLINVVESIGHKWTFPAWRNVLPDAGVETVPWDNLSVNADYISDFAEIEKRLNGDRKGRPFKCRMTSGNPALVAFQDREDCFGVVIPMRIGDAYDSFTGAKSALADVRADLDLAVSAVKMPIAAE